MPPAPSTEPWVRRAVRLGTEALAIDAPDGRLTYPQLDDASAALAARLAGDGLAAGDEVGLSLPSGAGFAIALHACLRGGFVAVPDDLRLPDERRAARLAPCKRVLDEAQVAPYRPEVSSRDATTEERARARFSGAWIDPVAGAGDDARTPAIRITTSGTTGPGTPVHLSRGALLWNAIGSAAALGQPADERWLSAMPVSHVGGLTVLVRSAIAGTTAVLRPRFGLDEQVGLLQSGAATITSVVPTTLGRLLDHGLDHPPNLRLVLLGGAPIPPELLDRARAAGVEVASTYGLSEACSQVLTRGRPLFCTQVVLHADVDPAGGDEILVRGPTLATGVVGGDGWFHTGDRGRRNDDGSFSIVGRIAETIVSGGENVAPTEVESELVALPGIADAAVLGIPHPEWGEQIEARVVLAPGASLDEAAVVAALRRTLPPYAVPKRVTAVDGLPRTPTGKLIRRDLH